MDTRRCEGVEFNSFSNPTFIIKNVFFISILALYIILSYIGLIIQIWNLSSGDLLSKIFFLGLPSPLILILLAYIIWIVIPERITFNKSGVSVRHWPIHREAKWPEVTKVSAVRTLDSGIARFTVGLRLGFFGVGTQPSLVITTKRWKQTILYDKYQFADIKAAFDYSIKNARAARSKVVVEDELGWITTGQHSDVSKDEFRRRDFGFIFKIGVALDMLGILGLVCTFFYEYFLFPSSTLIILGLLLIAIGAIGYFATTHTIKESKKKNRRAIRRHSD